MENFIFIFAVFRELRTLTPPDVCIFEFVAAPLLLCHVAAAAVKPKHVTVCE